MSYLATLARPPEMPTRLAAEPSPAPLVETFGEVHEAVVAAPREAAAVATDSRADWSDNPAPFVARDIGFMTQSPAAPIDLSSQPRAAPAPLLATEMVARSTPVAASLRRTPVAAEAPESSIEERSTEQTPWPVARRVGNSSPVPPADVEPAAPASAFPRLPIAPNAQPQVNVRIGAISLTVKAPVVAVPATKVVAAPMAQPLPAAVPARPRESLGFSASRHYLRWS